MRILLVVTGVGNGGHRNLFVIVQIPVALSSQVRVVRVGETDAEAEGPGVDTPRILIELEFGVVGDFIVEFQLVADFGDACLGDRAEVMIPPVDPFERVVPVGCPAEIGRINITGEPLFETM